MPIYDPSVTNAPPGYAPFTISSYDPTTGQRKTTTGYAPTVKPQPPAMPDMSAGIQAAYQHLPVEQAQRAIEAAIQYQGQRGYQRDLNNGVSASEAFAKWGPMMFGRSGAGMSQALQNVAPPPQLQRVPEGVTFGNRFYPKPDTRQQDYQAQVRAAAQAALAEPEAGTNLMAAVNKHPLAREDAGIQESLRNARLEQTNQSSEALRRGLAQYNRAQKELDAIREETGLDAPISRSKAKQWEAIKPRIQALRQIISDFENGAAPTTAGGPQSAPQSKSPFAEGALIKNKKTGKLFRVKDGVPVPVEE